MRMIAVVLGMGIIYILQAYLYANFWKRNLTAQVTFSKRRVTEGERVILEERLENRKWLPIPFLQLKFQVSRSFHEVNREKGRKLDHYDRNELFSIFMRQRIVRKVELECTQRGVFKVENLNLVAGNPFRKEDYLQPLPCDASITVDPCYVDVGRFQELFHMVYGNVITKQFVQEDPFLYRGVREYQPYDFMKFINWGATAKTGDLKVHVQEHTSQRNVSVYLNLQRDSLSLHSEVLEESIRLAKSFCVQFANCGIRTTLYTNGLDFETDNLIQVTDTVVGRNYKEMVNEGLARIKVVEASRATAEDKENVGNFLELYKNQIQNETASKYLVFISNYQRDDFQNMLLQIKKTTKDFLWIVPVSSARDYHPNQGVSHHTRMWRLNWESVRKEVSNAG